MRITEAAKQLGTTPRMLRYREALGPAAAVAGRAATPNASTTPATSPRSSSRSNWNTGTT